MLRQFEDYSYQLHIVGNRMRLVQDCLSLGLAPYISIRKQKWLFLALGKLLVRDGCKGIQKEVLYSGTEVVRETDA